jgi:hypothetical protein
MNSFLNGKWENLETRLLAVGFAKLVGELDPACGRFVLEFVLALAADAHVIGVDLARSLAATTSEPVSAKHISSFRVAVVSGAEASVEMTHRAGAAVPHITARTPSGSVAHPKTLKALMLWVRSLSTSSS